MTYNETIFLLLGFVIAYLSLPIKNIGPEYNWIYSGMSEDDQFNHVMNKKSYVLHYKGSSGNRVWSEMYNEKQINYWKKILNLELNFKKKI